MQATNEALTTFATYSAILGDLATAVGALGIALAAGGLRYQLQASHRAYEDIFGQRYHAMRERWPADLRTQKNLTLESRKLIQDYMHLAASECEARALNRVTNSTWKSWRRAIRHELFRSPTDNFYRVYHDAISTAKNDHKYRPLRELLAADQDEERRDYRAPMTYDPNSMSRIRRWLTGL